MVLVGQVLSHCVGKSKAEKEKIQLNLLDSVVSRSPFPEYFTNFQTKPNGQPGLYLLVQELIGNEVTHEGNCTQVGNLQKRATAFSIHLRKRKDEQ